MEFIFDFLLHPEGARLRDKVSHGEIDYSVDLENRFTIASELVFIAIHDLVTWFYIFATEIIKNI